MSATTVAPACPQAPASSNMGIHYDPVQDGKPELAYVWVCLAHVHKPQLDNGHIIAAFTGGLKDSEEGKFSQCVDF